MGVKLGTGLFEPTRTGCHRGKTGLGHSGQDGWHPVSAWEVWHGMPCHKRSGPKGQLSGSDILGCSVVPWLYQKRPPKPRTGYVNDVLKLSPLWSTTEGLGEVRGGTSTWDPFVRG